MKKNNFLVFFVLIVLFFSCKPSQRITTAWVNPERPAKKYTTVFVAALLQRSDIKYAIEDDLGGCSKSKRL